MERLGQDLSERFDQIMKLVLGRDDGMPLAPAWMLYLAREVAHTPWQLTLSPPGIALHAAARAAVNGEHGDVLFRRQICQLGGEMHCLGELLSCIVLSYERDQAGSSGMETPPSSTVEADAGSNMALMSTFTDLLERGDPNLDVYRDQAAPSWGQGYTALLFVRSPNPAEIWQEVWVRLAEQRRKIFYRWYGQDRVVDDPSLFLLYTGMAAFQLLVADADVGSEVTLHLWDRLYDAALSVVLRLGISGLRWPRADLWRRFVLFLFANLPHALSRGDIKIAANDRLHTTLARLGSDDQLVVECVALFSLNGVSSGDLQNAIVKGGVPLKDIVAQYNDTVGKLNQGPTTFRSRSALDVCRDLLRDP